MTVPDQLFLALATGLFVYLLVTLLRVNHVQGRAHEQP